MLGSRPSKILLFGALGLSAFLAVSCLLLPFGFPLVVISDIVTGLLMLCALLGFARNARGRTGRLRWFWLLQAAGWTLWLSDQLVWIAYDLVLRQKMPTMNPADALLFLAGAPMIAGLLLRPHRQPAEASARLGILDFFLLLLWWLYLYVSFIVCWQYVSPNLDGYNRNYDVLSWTQLLAFAGILILFWWESSGPWKKFYAVFAGTVVFNGLAFFLLNGALERGAYNTGSWYDVPYGASFAAFSAVAFLGSELSPGPVSSDQDTYSSVIANLAMIGVLSLPILTFSAVLDARLPRTVSDFRVLVTLATMFAMALLLFIQHRRLNSELRRTNQILEEASLTDPLTGLRNRRYFSATIEADVGQALRSHIDRHDPHTRDLVFYLIDADNFKEVNDRYGHDVGDKVLLEMARRLSSSIRHSDVLVRWGGEEFLIVSRYTDRTEAGLLAQRVLAAIADVPFALGTTAQTVRRTCSLGWAPFPWFPEDPRAVSYEEVLTLADRGLHRAKEAGRNRAVGMLPASGKMLSTTVAGLHSTSLQVDVLAIVGPTR